jgi:murein DD-endopeptidase MepM/ murein hydrolase activator NlpD
MVFGTSSAYAASTSELKEKKSKIQSQINEAEKELEKLSSQKKETQEYIAALDKKIQLKQDQIDVLQEDADELQSEIDTVESNIKKTEQEIEKTQDEIDQKQVEFDKTFDEYCQRLRAMYVSGHASNLEVLLTSSDISSILTRSQMIKSVSKQDSEILDSLMTQMEEIEKEKADLEQKRTELSEDKTKLESDKKELTDNIATIKESKAELADEVSECNALIKKLSNQSAEYQESIDENESQLAKVESQIKAAYAAASKGTGSISGSTGNGTHSGTLGYPTSYTSISAGYPNYSSGRYHGGVDFPCPSGTSVCAAASGTVIVAKNLNYSYGHYLIIDHGNGLSTLYAHNTTLLVSVGDTVSKGQVIAKSGSTGNSTGPHCHFEVRVNGTRVNPMNYL